MLLPLVLVVPVLCWLFVLGTAFGSFLNVCIVRLPRGRSLFWPGSHCGSCWRSIRLEHNIPLVSYWWLRGRCRQCGSPFSMRYFWVELLTGVVFVALFALEVIVNIHGIPQWSTRGFSFIMWGRFPPYFWELFLFHALFACLLIAAVGSLLEQGRIPHAVTVTGVILGLAGAVLLPWPWPNDHILTRVRPCPGFFPCPIWYPLPSWLPEGSGRLGLATGLAGLLAVWPWHIALTITGKVLGRDVREQAGEGILMMAGCFLGWQPVLAAVGIALPLALGGRWLRRYSPPLGVWLALGVVIAWLSWSWLGPVLFPC